MIIQLPYGCNMRLVMISNKLYQFRIWQDTSGGFQFSSLDTYTTRNVIPHLTKEIYFNTVQNNKRKLKSCFLNCIFCGYIIKYM
jgi:hypothetical protein